jgi:hypothetical protein
MPEQRSAPPFAAATSSLLSSWSFTIFYHRSKKQKTGNRPFPKPGTPLKMA